MRENLVAMRRPTLTAALALLLVGLTACSTPVPLSSPRTTVTSTTGATMTTVPATTTGAPLAFEPTGSSFIDAQEGWVLGATGCQSCAGLEVTNDGGDDWQALPAPPVPLVPYSQASNAVSDVYFADQSNGFLFGPGLETTHDGGQTWSAASLPSVTQKTGGDEYALAERSIMEMTGGDGFGYALAETSSGGEANLWRTTIGSNVWSPLSLPMTNGAPQNPNSDFPAFQLAVEGSTLLLLERGLNGPDVTVADLGALWMSTDAGSQWASSPVPCTPEDGGAAVASIAFGHPHAWLVDCFDNEQSMQEQDTQHHLYGSVDAGARWVRLADPTKSGEPELLADNGSGHAFLTTESGLGDELVATFDGGLQWSSLFASGGSFSGWADLEFVDASTGYVIGPTHYAPEHLYRTDDGGRTWRILPVASPG